MLHLPFHDEIYVYLVERIIILIATNTNCIPAALLLYGFYVQR